MPKSKKTARRNRIRPTILTLLVLALVVGIVVAAAVRMNAAPKHIGVNYLTLYHEYRTPDDRLQHDFALFEKDGINTIVISLYWYRIELSQGVYDKQFINNVTHVIRIAGTYGLSVMIDFHTLIGQSDAWSNPDYVGAGMNLINQSQIAADYIAMVKWTVTQLKGLPNIWAYSVLNEPWYWPLDSWRKSNWINLTVQLSQTVKAVDPKPVTVRFIGALFDRDWEWDPVMMKSLDFLSINAYLDDNSNESIYWSSWDQYKAGLGDIARNASAIGKTVQITEFGYSTPDDAVQEAIYREYVGIFQQTPNLTGWLSWGWDSSYDPNNPTWAAIHFYSIDVQATGTPRPAYSVLSQST